MNAKTTRPSFRTFSTTSATLLGALACTGLIAWSGCNRAGGGPPQMPKAEVQVSYPLVEKVTDYEEFTGHVEAKKTVTVRPRVTGKLLTVYFEEGAEVHEGDKLFLIDPEVYQSDYDRAAANLEQAQAHLNHAEADFQRAKNLISTKSISQADYDLAVGNRDEAKAAVSVADAAAKSAKINVDFCTVRADVTGRISRQLIDPGNIAMANQTALTTIVSLDPMYAYFDVDENTNLRIQRIIQRHKSGNSGGKGAPAYLALSDEKDFPHQGVVQFVDNQLDMTTGTLRFRGEFSNPDHMLSPGLFARVRVPIGEPHPAVLVPERSLVSDQGLKYLYVLRDDNTVSYRPVEIGGPHQGMREILSGVGEKDKVVVIGLQRLSPNATTVQVHPTVVSATAFLTQAPARAVAQANTSNAAEGPQLMPTAYKKDAPSAQPEAKSNKAPSDADAPATPPKRTSADVRRQGLKLEA